MLILGLLASCGVAELPRSRGRALLLRYGLSDGAGCLVARASRWPAFTNWLAPGAATGASVAVGLLYWSVHGLYAVQKGLWGV